jgi:hypothetical protein
MVKKCLRCNGDNDDNAIFCSSCGTRLSGARPAVVFGGKPGQSDLAARASIGFVMTIIGGFLIILGSLILPWVLSFLAISLPWGPPILPSWALVGIGVILGLFVILSSVLIYMPGYEPIGGMLAIVFSILSIMVLGGLIFGTILGLLGGLMAILKK